MAERKETRFFEDAYKGFKLCIMRSKMEEENKGIMLVSA